MKHRATLPLCCLLLSLAAGLPGRLAAQSGITPEEAEAIRQILELEAQIDTLLEGLSPAAREALERLRRGEGWEAPRLTPPPHPAAVPTPEAQAPPPPSPAVTAPPPLPPPRRGRCNALAAFDDNRDGVIDAADGVWRFLDLWDDRNGDGRVEPKEIKSAFAYGVREIAADLGSFEHKKGWAGDIDITDALTFDLGRRDRPVLVIEADGFNRGEGGPKLQGADGKALTGTLPFQAGWRLVFPEGTAETVVELDCP